MRVAVVCHILAHYRLAVLQDLDRSTKHEYTFFADDRDLEGVRALSAGVFARFVKAPFVMWAGFLWQTAAVKVAISPAFDAVIFLGSPYFLSTWIGAALSRLAGKRVFFWAHGWLRAESRVKVLVRNSFYRLAHKVLVYSERAIELGTASGFPRERIAVIYNSLDDSAAERMLSALGAGSAPTIVPQTLFKSPDRPLLICTARLTAACRFDLLMEAADLLSRENKPVNIILVGDGPEKRALEDSAAAKSIDVHFFGACYDENILGSLIYHSDMTVSPGKVGLTAIHSMMYGTPVITHSDLDAQMPEVEAIIPGVTGSFFHRGDVDALASAIAEWLSNGRTRQDVRDSCIKTVKAKWSSAMQARLIEAAIEANPL